jgi:hypothetical protein
MQAEFIFDDICNILLTPPEACRKYTQSTEAFEEVSNSWWTLLLVVVLGVTIFSIIVSGGLGSSWRTGGT